jgi:hypothetical protein
MICFSDKKKFRDPAPGSVLHRPNVTSTLQLYILTVASGNTTPMRRRIAFIVF